MKRLFAILMLMVGFASVVKAGAPVDPKYLSGAVPMENGMVMYHKTYAVPDKSAADIYAALRDYTQHNLVEGPDHGPQARITQDSPEEGLLVASIEETLWFLRRPMRSDFAQFYYQMIYEVKDGEFTVTMRSLRYLYNFSTNENDVTSLRAEEWITDKEALAKKGTKLARVNGKFRRCTIDRKDAIFAASAKAAGVKGQKKYIEVEEF